MDHFSETGAAWACQHCGTVVPFGGIHTCAASPPTEWPALLEGGDVLPLPAPKP